jgi:radical SAM protein with 4Fe4S-binding SPASM domain
MDKYRIDSHKLLYHPERVSRWLKGETIYPIYMEVSPTGSCNHRCTYCGLDFMEYQNRSLDTTLFKERLTEMGKLGLKSIMYAGEGEPFLHKDIGEIIRHTKASDIDVGVTTNAALLKSSLADEILAHVEWIKVSINGGNSETYAAVHRCKPAEFDTVIKNMRYASQIKAAKGYKCALGMQIVLLPENKDSVLELARIARDIGMNYLVIKPYSQHPQSLTRKYEDIKYSDFLSLSDELKKYGTNDFNVIFRLKTMKKWDEAERVYKNCNALPFWSYIDSGGNVWGCSVFLGDQRFAYGNIYEHTYQEIWEGAAREKSLRWSENELDTSQCRVNCRMDEVNRYLWELKSPMEHVNFI